MFKPNPDAPLPQRKCEASIEEEGWPVSPPTWRCIVNLHVDRLPGSTCPHQPRAELRWIRTVGTHGPRAWRSRHCPCGARRGQASSAWAQRLDAEFEGPCRLRGRRSRNAGKSRQSVQPPKRAEVEWALRRRGPSDPRRSTHRTGLLPRGRMAIVPGLGRSQIMKVSS